MRVGEALKLARVCRQQSKIASYAVTAAVLTVLADRYEAMARPATRLRTAMRKQRWVENPKRRFGWTERETVSKPLASPAFVSLRT